MTSRASRASRISRPTIDEKLERAFNIGAGFVQWDQAKQVLTEDEYRFWIQRFTDEEEELARRNDALHRA